MSRPILFALGLLVLIALAGCQTTGVSRAQAIRTATATVRSTRPDLSDYEKPTAHYSTMRPSGWLVVFKLKGIPVPDGDIICFVEANSGQARILHP